MQAPLPEGPFHKVEISCGSLPFLCLGLQAVACRTEGFGGDAGSIYANAEGGRR